MVQRLLRWRPAALVWRTGDAFFRCGGPDTAAALSYFLVLTLFPLLLCLNYLIGLFRLDLEQLLMGLHQFLPGQVLDLLGEYLRFTDQVRSPALLVLALGTIVLSASAGLRSLMLTLDRLYGREMDNGLKRIAVSVVLSLLFLLTMYLSVVVIFTGDWFFLALEGILPRPLAALIPLHALASLWRWLRYLLLFLFVLLLVLALYHVAIPRGRVSRRGLRMAALVTAAAMVLCSWMFSWFIGLSSRYSLVYGSLASLVILLVWLYFCGNILLLGAVLAKVGTEIWKKDQR